MCSSCEGAARRPRACDVVAAAAGLRPTELVEAIDGLLGHLHAADLTGLTAPEHQVLVTRLAGTRSRVHAAALDAIAAFDAADVASLSRHRTTKRWIEHRTRATPGAAAADVRAARAVRDHLPATRAALCRAAISPAHATAIVRVVRTVGAEHATIAEPVLLDLARRFDPSVVRRASAELFAMVDPEGAERAAHAAYDRRGVTLSVVGDHGYLDGVFDVESAELLRTALEPLMASAGADDARTTPQRRADALLDLAQHRLDTGGQPVLGSQRPHLSVVIDSDRLQTGRGGVTLPWTGAVVPAPAVRRWACDAVLSPVLARLLPPPRHLPLRFSFADPRNAGAGVGTAPPALGGGWLPLDVGRSHRLATSGQIKALRVRDGGCVHPGCARTAAYCHAHHVTSWLDGGPTSLDNLVLLCRHHHRTLHQGAWSLHTDRASPHRFLATTAAGVVPAQNAADRSPPIRPPTALAALASQDSP